MPGILNTAMTGMPKANDPNDEIWKRAV